MLYYLLRACISVAIVLVAGWQWWKRVKKNRLNGANGCVQHGCGQDTAQKQSENWPFSSSNSSILCRIDCDGPISSLMFLAGGKRIATFLRDDHKLRVWSIESGRPLEETDSLDNTHDGNVATSATAASKDGKYFVSGDDHGNVIIWNTSAYPPQKMRNLKLDAADGKITTLDISPDSLRVVSGSEDGVVVVWCIETGRQLVGPLKQDSPVSSVKFSPVGYRIAAAYHAVGQDTCSVRIWRSYTGAQLESISTPIAQQAYSLAWSTDGQRLFFGGCNGSIKCFDVVSRCLLPEFRAPSRDLITSLFMANGQLLVSISTGRAKFIDFWDIQNTNTSEPFRSCRNLCIASISPDNARLAIVGKENDITVWNLSTVIHETDLLYPVRPFPGHIEPFTYISNAVYAAWKGGKLAEAEELLSKEIQDHRYRYFARYGRANRALVRLRRKNFSGALEDADAIMSSGSQTLLISALAKGLALHGNGDIPQATCAFQSALDACDSNVKHFVEFIKSITFFDVGCLDRMHLDTNTSVDLLDVNLHRLVEARKRFEVAYYHMDRKDYEKVLELLQTIPDLRPLFHASEVTAISLIFDWNIDSLVFDIHELRCRASFESCRTLVPGVFGYFSDGHLSEKLEILTAELGLPSEKFGDEAMCRNRYEEAITWYTESLTLAGYSSDTTNKGIPKPQIEQHTVFIPEKDDVTPKFWASPSRRPQWIARLLVKRSKGEAATKRWEDTLRDANWAIKMDPSYRLAYESKYEAQRGMKRHKDGYATLTEMYSKFNDPRMSELHKNHQDTLAEIDKITKTIFDASPFVLIHVKDGRLYNQEEQKRKFKDDESFYELVLSTLTPPNTTNIKEVVERYFHYVMFSHTWEENEPSFQNVSENPANNHSNEKLRKLYETVRRDYPHYQWLWSDTCCIDKQNSDLYLKSIRFMYKWYRNSAFTLVLLAHPSKSTPPNSPDLEHNRWMFRAWTLQELLAPKVIRFYRRDWQLYDQHEDMDHKTSDKIKRALARAIGVEENALIHFNPKRLPVRQRLRLASTRSATEKVDIAYSLIGILNSDNHVDYTCEADVALGRLLQECVNRRGEVTVLDWVGRSSTFNSCIPAEISVYSQRPYALPFITADELNERAEALGRSLPEQEITQFYRKLTSPHSPRFVDRRLSLPCITFVVTSTKPTTSNSQSNQGSPSAYVASTTAFGNFNFETEDTSFSELQDPRSIVVVYPWIPDIRAKIDYHGGDELTKALTLIAYLERGFKALLFMEHSRHQYRRVAADGEIRIPTRGLKSLKGISFEVLEVVDPEG